MKIFRLFRTQDAFTFANAAAGIISIIYSIRQSFTLAAIFLLTAVFMDFLDGKVARFFKGMHAFGRELDSLADAISFGVAAAAFGYMFIETNSMNSILTVAILVFFVLCGIARLARFNITKIKGYEGIPITMNGLIVPLIYFVKLPAAYYPIIYLISGMLMISAIKIKKIV